MDERHKSIDRRNFLATLAGGTISLGAGCSAIYKKRSKLNIILIFSDDHGYGDLGCWGADDLLTPHIDALAENGIKMMNFYSCSPVCSPARAGLLTGRYPDRTGVLGVMRRQHDHMGMDLNEITVADILSKTGYATGLVGKWHVGVPPDYRPRARGFQETYGPINGAIDYYTHIGGGGLDGQPSFYRNDDLVEEEGYFTDLANREALNFIDRHHHEPFFLYLPYTAPHLPMQAPDKYLNLFPELKKSNPMRAYYAAMLYCMDQGVGQLVEKLNSYGIADNTIIIFLSDQGWVQRNKKDLAVSSNGGLSEKGLPGGKYYLAEGGIHVPCIISIPGYKPGVNYSLAINLDLYTTILSMAGCKTPRDRIIDGIDLLPSLGDPPKHPERTLFWKFRDDWVRTGDQYAVREGRWKLILQNERLYLFDIERDPAETQDLLSENPDVVKRLQAKYREWEESLPDIKWQSRPKDLGP